MEWVSVESPGAHMRRSEGFSRDPTPAGHVCKTDIPGRQTQVAQRRQTPNEKEKKANAGQQTRSKTESTAQESSAGRKDHQANNTHITDTVIGANAQTVVPQRQEQDRNLRIQII